MRLPKSAYNWTSFLGASIAIIALFLIGFFFAVSILFDQGSSYVGLVIYIVLPLFLILGLVLIPIGMLIKIKKERKTDNSNNEKWPQINLNDRQHRNAFIIFAITTTLFLFLSSVGSYEAFHYTESNQFCGTLCHSVMEPEYTTYQNSAHARVACVECHVGPGADWYVRSKLSGLYQVYSVLMDKYPRPIATPIHNLRPARETCEKCHWPEKFYTQRIKNEKHFLADENNTEWNIQLLMKTGGEHQTQKLSEGIHWHINPKVKIEYYTPDESEQFIPWVKYTNTNTGQEFIYTDEEFPPDSTLLQKGKYHLMDCMDCHNRPSHGFLSPPDFIDHAIAAGRIPQNLKHVKFAAMEALKDAYSSKDSANFNIEKIISNYYVLNHPRIAETHNIQIRQSIEAIQKSYHIHNFPHMNVRWDVYPDHRGHMESEGCFRCHNDRHKTAEGRVISKDCRLCHDITAQGIPGNMQLALPGESLEFEHPVDIGTDWKEYSCVDCHAYLYP
ncbi:MAG: NapC/NirT family cytochrome c [Marinifilaceae bacterium]